MGALVGGRSRPLVEEATPPKLLPHRGGRSWSCRRGYEVILLLSGVALAAGKKDRGPLCHAEFRALERCLSNDYDRLQAQCAQDYGGVRACLERDWKHIDDARGYKRADGSFNRMKRCRHGVMLFNPLDWYIGRGLEVYGEWGEKKVQIWQRIVKPGHVAVDVGAHIGALTLPLAGLVGDRGRVVAFEPFYPSFATLAANVGLNSLQNVEVRQAVVTDRVGRLFMNRRSLAFKMNDFFNFGSVSFNNLRIYNASDDVERASTDWDEYATMPLDQMSLGRLDFVKIDAEAMELSVLEGAMRMLKKFKPVLFLEYRNPWEKDTELLALLQGKLRYECVLLRLPVFNTENHRGHAEDIWGIEARLVSFNLLCKHRWWEYPDMDDAVLELFDTAVDTDVEGLRTTPSADPFESLGASARPSGVEDVTAAKARSGPPSAASDARQPVRAAGGKAQKKPRSEKRFQDMTLDELLGDEPDKAEAGGPATPLAPAPSERGQAAQPAAGRGAGEQSARGRPPAGQPAAKVQGKKKVAKEASKETERGGRSKTAGPGKPRASAASAEQARRPYEEITLDELMAETSGAGAGRDREGEEVSLEELLGPEPPARAPAAARVPEDPSLEELLQAAPGGEGGGPPGAEAATLEELLGSEEEGGARGYQDLTLDELLGPEPPEGEASPLDDLLGGGPDEPKYEDMSLDELLGLDDAAPAPPPAPRGRPGPTKAAERPKAPSQPKAGKAGAKRPREARQKPAVGAGEADRKTGVSGAGAGKEGPRVRVSYEEELTLDEL